MRYLRTLAVTLALAVTIVACQSGGDDSSAISEERAIELAEAEGVAQGMSLDGLSPKTSQVDGAWRVSFDPTDSNQLGGGFVVLVDTESGAITDFKRYQ